MTKNRVFRKGLILGWAVIAGMGMLTGCQNTGEPNGSEPVAFAQATDPQLGMGGFSADVARLTQEARQINQSPARFTIICGDLVHQPNLPSYREFCQQLKEFKQPVYCVPGNHDAPDSVRLIQFRKMIGPDHQTFTAGGLAFILLNSNLIFSQTEPDYSWQQHWLKTTLQQYAGQKMPIVVAMHHPPFVNNPDEKNEYFNLPKPQRKELLRLFKQYGVIAVLYGHTHQTKISNYDGIFYAGCPNTSVNFDRHQPGFLLWRYDGSTLTPTVVNLKMPAVPTAAPATAK